MKKDRNTFFQESQFMNQTTAGYPNMNMMNTPYTTASYGNQGFYAGPIAADPMNTGIPANYTTGMPNNTNYNSNYSDLEARMSKIERQISRLDTRISKLESNGFYTTDDIDTTNNIYMV